MNSTLHNVLHLTWHHTALFLKPHCFRKHITSRHTITPNKKAYLKTLYLPVLKTQINLLPITITPLDIVMNYTDFYVKCVPPELVLPCQYQKVNASMAMVQSYASVPYSRERTSVLAGRSPLPHCSTSLCSGWSVSGALLSYWPPARRMTQIGLELPPCPALFGLDSPGLATTGHSWALLRLQ